MKEGEDANAQTMRIRQKYLYMGTLATNPVKEDGNISAAESEINLVQRTRGWGITSKVDNLR